MARDFREWVLWSVGVAIEVRDISGDPERERLKRVIGADRARRVLTALAAHADAHGQAFPSVKTLTDLTALTRWTVRDALDYLAVAGVIAAAGTRARGVIVWQLSPGGDARPGGVPRHMAGDMAGDMAGNMAGTPDAEQEREREDRYYVAASVGTDGDRLAPIEAAVGGFDGTEETTASEMLDRYPDAAIVNTILAARRRSPWD